MKHLINIFQLCVITGLLFFFPACRKKESGNSLLSVSTVKIYAVSSGGANCIGNISSQGSSRVTGKGVCWSQSPMPVAEYPFYSETGHAWGDFTSPIGALQPETKYYVRAFARNSAGTAYGEELTFTTLPDKE